MISFLRSVLKLLALLMVLGVGGFWLHQQGKLDFAPIKRLMGSGEELVTYYQWTDAAGQVHISESPPEQGVSYSLFKGSPGLTKYTQPQVEVSSVRETAAQPEIKVLSTYRDSLEEKLLQKEMTTQCRWLVSRIFELERQVQEAEGHQIELLCREYREQILLLPKKHCKASAGDIAPQVC